MQKTQKNPSDTLVGNMPGIAALAAKAIAVAQRPTPPAKAFTPQFGACEAHGPYPRNVQDSEGRERWFADVCPGCTKAKNSARLMESSNIPKRFINCSFDSYIAVTDEQRHVLARCMSYARDFSAAKEAGACLILCGHPGTGKNHLATAISKHLLESGYSVLRVKASQYLDAYWSKGFDERESWVRSMAAVDLLMIDEIGRSSNAKTAQDAFFRLLDARYEAQLPSLLATNLTRAELVEVLGDATYDRLTQGGGVRLTFGWDSYRAAA
jgi:DNA replication protein DnaC